jgi:hypothetical protein
MSRPRFLANHDLSEAIVLGVMRREPLIEFHRLRDVGLADRPDPQVLEFAASQGLLVVSHDVNTMTAHAAARILSGETFPGIFLAHQSESIGAVIEQLILIWTASEAEEWVNQVTFLPI